MQFKFGRKWLTIEQTNLTENKHKFNRFTLPDLSQMFTESIYQNYFVPMGFINTAAYL